MSSESELTDISSEDYDSEPDAESSKKRKVKGPVYTIKNALNPPITAQVSLWGRDILCTSVLTVA